MGTNKNDETNVCSKCGATLVEGILFCPSCGAPVNQVEEEKVEKVAETVEEKVEETVKATSEEVVETSEEKTVEVKETVNDASQETVAQPATPVQPATPAQPGTASEENELMNKIKAFGTAKLAAICGGILAVIIVISIIVSNHKTTINLEDYVKVEVEGYDGNGEADVSWKSDELDKAIIEALGYDDEDDLEDLDSGKALEAYSAYLDIKDSLKLKTNKTEDLSNGDKIKVTIKYDNEVAGKYGIKFKGDTYEMTVSGLEELRKVDPFDGLTVSFDGKSPSVRVNFDYDGKEDFINSYDFRADTDDEVRLGDKITVTCDISDYTLKEEGVQLTSTTKEYTVENVDAYFETLADVESEALEDLKKETEDVITSYFAEQKDHIKQDGLTYEGCYLLTSKDGDAWYGYNKAYVIYSANVSSKEKGSDKKFETTKVYFPVKFKEVIKAQDGKITWERYSYDGIQGETELEFGWRNVKGYTDGKDMYEELISPDKAEYNYEISASLQSFGN